MSRLFKKCFSLTTWRESIPTDATAFNVTRFLNTLPVNFSGIHGLGDSPGSTLEVTELRVRFKITRTLTKTPNACDVWIHNLSPETRAGIEVRPLSVQLEAGYDDTPRLMFVGNLLFGMSEWKNGSWITLLQCSDGDRAYNHARVNRSYAPGVTAYDALVGVVRSIGLTIPKKLQNDERLAVQYVTGLCSHGPARDELTRILDRVGYGWSIQNGVLRVLRDDEVSSADPLPIDEDHGLLDSPSYGSPPKSGKPPHVTCKLRLYPELTPGDLVQLTSKSLNGRYRIEKVEHEGDSRGSSWYTNIEVKPL